MSVKTVNIHYSVPILSQVGKQFHSEVLPQSASRFVLPKSVSYSPQITKTISPRLPNSRSPKNLAIGEFKLTYPPSEKQINKAYGQQKHLDEIIKIVNAQGGYIDTSQMGSGKTIIAFLVSLHFNLPLLVVCPKGACPNWIDGMAEYGIPHFGVISYSMLSGRRNCNLSHDLLTRCDYVNDQNHNKKHFSVTKKFTDILAKGALVIFDEVHFNKNNNTGTHMACEALMKAIRISNSKFGFLSGTIADSSDSLISIMKLAGIIRQNELYSNYFGREVKNKGLDDVITFAYKCDYEKTIKIVSPFKKEKISVAKSKALVAKLYTDIIKYNVSSGMIPKIDKNFDIANGKYKIETNELDKMIDALKRLKEIVFSNDGCGVKIDKINITQHTQLLITIENTLVPSVIESTLKDWNKNPKQKIAIFAWYIDTINMLKDYYEKNDKKPIVITGEINDPYQRSILVKRFNTNPDYNIIILQGKVGSTNISLHDTVGDAPRKSYIFPSYNFIDNLQAAYRIYRVGLKSDAVVRFVYAADQISLHKKILYAISKKGILAEAVVNNRYDYDEEMMTTEDGKIRVNGSTIYPQDYPDTDEF